MSQIARIIGCPAWGAKPPRHGLDSIEWTGGPATRIIWHHTAGHHPEIENPRDESEAEAIRYALDIQHYHQSPSRTDPSKPWNDSGHNFLVCRNGITLQGRWRTIRAIQDGKMVVSAHCPGQNTQIGIENEHKGTEAMTPEQREAAAKLMAWIANEYGRHIVLPVYPHSTFFPTSCPVNLTADIPRIKRRAQQILTESQV